MATYTTLTSDKSKKTAAGLCALGFVGIGGLHYFYVGRISKGILYFLTIGFFFIGTIIDIIKITQGGFVDNVGMPLRTSTPKAEVAGSSSEYTHKTFKVAGVSYSNEDGERRQSILRKIKFCDPPFDNGAELELRAYKYEGKPAYGVYANDRQIGNIPSADTAFIADNWAKLICFTAINVYGGGKGDDGEQKHFGAEVVLRFGK